MHGYEAQRTRCGCRKCHGRHTLMFWTIVTLLLIIIVMLMKQSKML